jgi:hypothetical protein
MWTEITRPECERAGRCYASDLTDPEWRLIELFMPPVKRLGRPRETDLRAVVDAILYICPSRLPMVPAAKGLSAVHHGARLFLRLAGRELVRADQF